MGYQLAVAALAMAPDYPHVTPRARVVLVTMCLLARDRATDTQPAARYWGGHLALATGLGFRVFDRAAERAVSRAVRELRDCKLVVVVDYPHPGENTEYRLCITGWNHAAARRER